MMIHLILEIDPSAGKMPNVAAAHPTKQPDASLARLQASEPASMVSFLRVATLEAKLWVVTAAYQ